MNRPGGKASDVKRRVQPSASSEHRPKAFSYHASRSGSTNNVGRELTRETTGPRKVRNWRLPLAIITATLVFMVLSYQSTTPTVNVIGSKQSRELLQPAQTYQIGANKVLASSFWNHFKPFVNTNQLAASIKDQFPEVARVEIHQPLFGMQARVSIQAYAPVLVLAGNGGSFIVDQTGTTRAAVGQVSAATAAALPTVTDQSGLALHLGEAALPTSNVDFIQSVLAGLTASKLNWQQLLLPAASSEFDVRLTGKPFVIKFAMQGGASATQQLGTYLAAAGQAQGATQYVDVRVPERLYYK